MGAGPSNDGWCHGRGEGEDEDDEGQVGFSPEAQVLLKAMDMVVAKGEVAAAAAAVLDDKQW
jgi:hypothetical protein